MSYSSTLIRKEDAALNWKKINSLPESCLQPLHDLPPYRWDYLVGLQWSEPRANVEIRQRK